MSDFINGLVSVKGTAAVLVGTFLICFIGYALGRIKIKGISLGDSGVFIIALLFGWLFTLPVLKDIPVLSQFYIPNSGSSMFTSYKFIQTIGLVLFVTAVGYIAGPRFFKNLKKNAKSYVPLGAIIILVGVGITVLFALIPGIGADFSNGILSGALTSTPAFSAAQEVAENRGLVSLGHAIAYPFGVIGVVVFVQLMPKLMKADMSHECELIKGTANTATAEKKTKKLFQLEDHGFAPFGLAVVLGIILGSVKIPLTANGFDGACFSLGNTGGPLIVALILGHFGRIGRLDIKVSEHMLKIFRELGLILFLTGAGVEGGVELVAQVSNSTYGPMIILYGFLAGAVMTIVPLIVGFILAKKVFKLSLLNNLGSLTGGMTSTPALGTLIGVSGSDDVAAAYASTYPVALVLIVLASNLIGTFL